MSQNMFRQCVCEVPRDGHTLIGHTDRNKTHHSKLSSFCKINKTVN